MLNTFLIYSLYCATQRPSVCLLLHSPFVVNTLHCGHSRLKWPTMETVITFNRGLKITTACDMQSRASPFPRSSFSIASIFGVLTENTNQDLSAASLLSDHRLVFSSSTSPPPSRRCAGVGCNYHESAEGRNSTKPRGPYQSSLHILVH